jgi:hypothetical protein
MKKTIAYLLLSIFLAVPLFAAYENEDADAETLAVTATDTGVTNTAGQAQTPAAVAPASAEYVTPIALPNYRNAIGIEIGLLNKTVPGISYTREFGDDNFGSVFIGAVYDGTTFAGNFSVNGYHMFGDYFYAGLGFSAMTTDNGSVLLGIGNPSVGLISELFLNLKLFIETDVLLMVSPAQQNNNTGDITSGTMLLFRMGLKYYY